METLADRYELEERLGSGGTAVVWRATDTTLGVTRAVKILHVAHGPERKALRERLRNEARAMAQLSHPGVVAVHDVGDDGDRDFIVMDLVDGDSLADKLDRDGPVTAEEGVRLGVQVLDALSAAHAVGIVHRDVKPGNVLLDGDGNAHLCDFGIALAQAADNRHTRTGAALGSLPYMAPEQRRDARTVGPAADVYAVGCMLYNALTCATPVDLYLAPGRSPRWGAVPSSLVSVLRIATAAEAGDRYPDAEAMSRALVLASRPPEKAPESLVDAEPVMDDAKPRLFSGMLWVNLTLFGLVLLISGFVVYELDRRTSQPGESPIVQPAAVAEYDWPVSGNWMGPWDGRQPGITVRLAGPNDALSGSVLLQLGSNERTSTVTGQWDIYAGRLTLTEPSNLPGSGEYVAEIDEFGVLKGTFRSYSEGNTVSFALVRAQ